jgi:hypothetical protein
MFTRRWWLTLIAAAALAAGGDGGRIVGRSDDLAHCPNRCGVVRLTPEDGGPTLAQTDVDGEGNFAFEDVKPGVYRVRISMRSFREGSIPVVVRAGATVDLGHTGPGDFLSAWPGMNIDCMWSGPRAPEQACPLIAQGYVHVKRGCGADLEAGRSTCEHPDFVLAPGHGKALCLFPADGVKMAPVNGSKSGDWGYSNKPIRIDGYGAGNDFGVRKRHTRSNWHVLIMEPVEPDSAEITLWYVERACSAPWDHPCE